MAKEDPSKVAIKRSASQANLIVGLTEVERLLGLQESYPDIVYVWPGDYIRDLACLSLSMYIGEICFAGAHLMTRIKRVSLFGLPVADDETTQKGILDEGINSKQMIKIGLVTPSLQRCKCRCFISPLFNENNCHSHSPLPDAK